MNAKYMEDLLDMPLREVLPVIQESIIKQTTYFGVGAQKSPFDAWIYQEIMYETKPDVIIEIGTARGGGTLFLAHLCDLLGKGRIIGVDLSHRNVPETVKQHPRITLIEGDACQNFEHIKKMTCKDDRVLIIEDSSHTYENTLNILRLYSILVKPGDYFIVEDGICRHGLEVGPDPGPYEAIETFVMENKQFEIDRSREHFFITWNPKGYLRRKRT
jgi:cephalosporin hydroxylase